MGQLQETGDHWGGHIVLGSILAFHMICVFAMGPGHLEFGFWLYLLIKACISQDLSLKAGKWARKLERVLGLWSQG